MSESPHPSPEVPETREGWFVLHDCYVVDWPRWRACSAGIEMIAEAQAWLERMQGAARGDSAMYSVVGQKADLLFLHYRDSVEALDEVELSFRRLRLHEFLKPSFSFLSVIELGLYEASAAARRALAARGRRPEDPGYEEAYREELARLTAELDARLFRRIPAQRHLCFYPMSKRRGEQRNWYALSSEERRQLMRGHGQVGARYRERVVQVISGAIGLDNWEWGVDLHADDPLVFKKLVTEMRYDPASAWYAEFGPFFIGIRHSPEDLTELLA
ncbi:MAG: heme-dependent peroxidase [Planctomycetota bacterium]|nr:heme-dependent peroxidase [Planctomycetota bacterium]